MKNAAALPVHSENHHCHLKGRGASLCPLLLHDSPGALLISILCKEIAGRESLLEKKNNTRDVVITVLNIPSNASDAAVRDLKQQLLETRW